MAFEPNNYDKQFIFEFDRSWILVLEAMFGADDWWTSTPLNKLYIYGMYFENSWVLKLP